MSQGFTLKITQGVGYTGMRGERAWVARVVGTDADYGLRREFRDADTIERDHFGRARYMRTYTHLLSDGLYEVSESGERRYILVWTRRQDGTTVATRTDAARAAEIARRMDDGVEYDAARRETAPAKSGSQGGDAR